MARVITVIPNVLRNRLTPWNISSQPHVKSAPNDSNSRGLTVIDGIGVFSSI